MSCNSRVTFTSGSVLLHSMTCQKKDSAGVWQALTINSGSLITFTVRDMHAPTTIYIGPVSVVEGTAGSDWANGVIVVSLSATDTAFSTETDEAEIIVNVNDSTAGEELDYIQDNVNLVIGT